MKMEDIIRECKGAVSEVLDDLQANNVLAYDNIHFDHFDYAKWINKILAFAKTNNNPSTLADVTKAGTIERLCVENFVVAAYMQEQAFQGTDYYHGPLDSLAEIAAALMTSELSFLQYDEHGAPVGHLITMSGKLKAANYGLEEKAPCMYVAWLATRPSAQRSGYGKKLLLHFFEEWAKNPVPIFAELRKATAYKMLHRLNFSFLKVEELAHESEVVNVLIQKK